MLGTSLVVLREAFFCSRFRYKSWRKVRFAEPLATAHVVKVVTTAMATIRGQALAGVVVPFEAGGRVKRRKLDHPSLVMISYPVVWNCDFTGHVDLSAPVKKTIQWERPKPASKKRPDASVDFLVLVNEDSADAAEGDGREEAIDLAAMLEEVLDEMGVGEAAGERLDNLSEDAFDHGDDVEEPPLDPPAEVPDPEARVISPIAFVDEHIKGLVLADVQAKIATMQRNMSNAKERARISRGRPISKNCISLVILETWDCVT